MVGKVNGYIPNIFRALYFMFLTARGTIQRSPDTVETPDMENVSAAVKGTLSLRLSKFSLLFGSPLSSGCL